MTGSPVAEQPYSYPRFSLAERDRRWKAVRALMAERGIDVIVTPQNTGHSMDFQADSRYLTHCGGGGDADIAAVFPLEGEVTAIATSAVPRWTPRVQDWTKDVREARRDYGKQIVTRIKELGLKKPRIGIAALGEIGGTRRRRRLGSVGRDSIRPLEERLGSADPLQLDFGPQRGAHPDATDVS